MLDYTKATEAQLKEEFKRLAQVVSDIPFGTKKEFFNLPKILNE
ncbi:hypothetical protein [Candidatus Erwinia dacicola]|nr:hypothetical protein [Candidatus Erwinia dacicola]